jgi:hypothetical protein
MVKLLKSTGSRCTQSSYRSGCLTCHLCLHLCRANRSNRPNRTNRSNRSIARYACFYFLRECARLKHTIRCSSLVPMRPHHQHGSSHCHVNGDQDVAALMCVRGLSANPQYNQRHFLRFEQYCYLLVPICLLICALQVRCAHVNGSTSGT